MGKIVSLNNEKITQKYQKRHAKIAWNLAKFFAKTTFKSTLKKDVIFWKFGLKNLKILLIFSLKKLRKISVIFIKLCKNLFRKLFAIQFIL